MSSVQTGPHVGHLTKQPGSSSGEPTDAAALVKSLIGSGVIQEKAPRSVEYWQGNSMPDTGLAYNISGRATVIEANVGESLVGFEDPIKGVFSTQVCTDKSVLVKRKWVVGGKAVLTPERSAARSVSVKEDVVKVELARYGGDVSMNTNLFLDAPLAKEELDMKVNAQKRELERKLIELGYAELMGRALRLPTAFVRSTVRGGGAMTSTQRDKIQERRAKAVYMNACFGAFGKYEFPLSNLLAAAKTATAYTGTSGPGDIMIVPHGTPEMLRYTKQSSVEYKINGLKTTDHAPITMQMDNFFEDPSSGVKIAIHRPLASYSHGSAFPEAGRNCLEETVAVWLYYPMPPKGYTLCTTNFLDGDFTCTPTHGQAGTVTSDVTGNGSVNDHLAQLASDSDNAFGQFFFNESTGANAYAGGVSSPESDKQTISSFYQAESIFEMITAIIPEYAGTAESDPTAFSDFINSRAKELTTRVIALSSSAGEDFSTSSIEESEDATSLGRLCQDMLQAFDGQMETTPYKAKLAIFRIMASQKKIAGDLLKYEYVRGRYLKFSNRGQTAKVTLGKFDDAKRVDAVVDDIVSKEKESPNDLSAVQALIAGSGVAFYFKAEAAAIPQPDMGGNPYVEPQAHNGNNGPYHYVRRIEFSMLSAVIAKAGSETGSLLVGYPMTSVSTNARTESMTVALRVYLGSILKRPENALVLPHVAFGGVLNDTGLLPADVYEREATASGAELELDNVPDGVERAYAEANTHKGLDAAAKAKFYKIEKKSNANLGASTKGHRLFQITGTLSGNQAATDNIAKLNKELLLTDDLNLSRGGYSIQKNGVAAVAATGGGSATPASGAENPSGWHQNTGCLGVLDHPYYYDVLQGLQVYKGGVRQYEHVSTGGGRTK